MSAATNWVQLSSAPGLLSRREPYLVNEGDRRALFQFLTASGGIVKTLDLRGLRSSVDFFARLKEVLTFPSWVGGGWDSFDDAFQDILAASEFPLFVFADGLDNALETNPHLALEMVIRLHDAQAAFATAQAQFVVIYIGEWKHPRSRSEPLDQAPQKVI